MIPLSDWTELTVVEVLAFENLPAGEMASRRAVVLWSDGTQGEALRWDDDEVLVCEGDHGNCRLMSRRGENAECCWMTSRVEGPIIS